MITIESLRAFGANVDAGLERCLNKEDFYLKMVNMALSDQRFTDLEPALAQKDYEKAFEMCHALKGTTGNVSLDPLYDAVCEMTELLRAKTDTDYSSLYKKIIDMRNEILQM